MKDALKICNKFTGEHPCQSAISIRFFCNFNEIALRHGCSPVNLLHISRIPCLKNTTEGLLLLIIYFFFNKSHNSMSTYNNNFKKLICGGQFPQSIIASWMIYFQNQQNGVKRANNPEDFLHC